MDMLWFKNIPIIWISAGIPLTIVGVYFLVKFFDRTNRIDEKQRQQIALNEAKIERIKNENYENIQRNSNSSGWLSSIYFLIFFGDSVTQKINIKLWRKVSDKIDVASSSFLSLSYYQDKNKKDQEPIIFYQTENQNEVLISTQNMYKYSITSAKNLAQLVCVKDFFESEIKDILKKISPEEKIKNEQ